MEKVTHLIIIIHVCFVVWCAFPTLSHFKSHFRIAQEFIRIFTSNHQFSRNIFAPTSTVIRFLLPSVTMIRNVFMAGLCAASVPMITAVRLEERKIAKYMLHEKLKKNFRSSIFVKFVPKTSKLLQNHQILYQNRKKLRKLGTRRLSRYLPRCVLHRFRQE